MNPPDCRPQHPGRNPVQSARMLVTSLLLAAQTLAASPVAGPALPAAPSPIPPLGFPTANRTLLEPGGEERYFVGTVGRPWTSGTFGCVRTEGWQMHEGIDIASLERDRAGEPTDPILATADGVVCYINRNAGLSNYGIYVVLLHQLNGLELYSLYAHLARLRDGLAAGQRLLAGEAFATMGRTANTREGISKDRAHLHFEVNLLINEHYASWHQLNDRTSRNDHGLWNGLNLLGMDPHLLLLSSHRFPHNFDIARFLRLQPDLCRVAVRATEFPWLNRYPMLVMPRDSDNPAPIAGYELHFDYTGIPVRAYPRTESQLQSAQRYSLVAVNEDVYRRNPCRRIVVRKGNRFELGTAGLRLLDLLTYAPTTP
jgi:peptidoglycan LD-endopeptidase LytH